MIEFLQGHLLYNSLVEFILKTQPEDVSIIAVGDIKRNAERDEDNLCAQMFLDRLLGRPADELCIRKKLSKRIEERRQDPETPGPIVEKDISLCTAIGILDFIPEILYHNGQVTVINSTPLE